MQLCGIVPVDKTEWMYKDKIVMTLAHLFEKYPDTYGKVNLDHPKNYVIMDNSVVELGSTFTIDKMVALADKQIVDELILPDGYPSGKKTVELVKESIKWLKDNDRLGCYKLMGVCHGENYEEFVETFNTLNNMPEIDVLGIPKVLQKWLPSKSREEVANIFLNTSKEIHLLGTWYSLKEIVEMSPEILSKIRSVDTCLPFYYAYKKESILKDRDGTIDLEASYQVKEREYRKVFKEFKKELRKHKYD